MTRVIVSLVGGASLGGIYALVSLGLVLAYRATGTFNFAHGQFMLLPALIVGSWQSSDKAPLAVSIVVALAIVGAVSMLFFLVVLQKTVGMPHFMGVIATLGLAAVLDGVMSIIFGHRDYGIHIPALPTGVTEIFGARVSKTSLSITLITVVLALAVAGTLRFTHLGTKVRAAGQDALLASQGGINVRRVHMASWGLAAVLAGIGGIMFGSTNIVNSSLIAIALAAFPAIMLGGLDSIEGALVGGMCIGIFQAFIATYFGGAALDATTYGLLLVVLIFRAQGIFGTRQAARV